MTHSIKIGLTFILISLSQLIYSNQPDRIKLIDLKLYSRENLEYNLNDTIAKIGRVILDYKSAGRFSINYDIDSLSKTEIIKYMIEGFDYDWIPADVCKSIMITNLVAGRYIIKIGIFDDNTKIEEKTINLIITPPFWKTWWFKALLTLVIFGVFLVSIIVLIINNMRLTTKLKNVNK